MRPSILQTNKYELRPYSIHDENRFVEMSLEEEVVRFMDGANGDEDEERALFKKIFDIYAATSSNRVFNIWGIYEKDKLCGHLELKETEHTSDKELEIVYMIHPAARGKGIMCEVLDFFKENQFFLQKRIIATVHKENTKSRRLLKRWGIDRQEFYKEGEEEFVAGQAFVAQKLNPAVP